MTPRLKKSVAGEARWPTCQQVSDDHRGDHDDHEEDHDDHEEDHEEGHDDHVRMTTYLSILAMCNFRSHEPHGATKTTESMKDEEVGLDVDEISPVCVTIGESPGKTKVDQLEPELLARVNEHHILGFQIEVDDVRVVDEDQRLHNLKHEPEHFDDAVENKANLEEYKDHHVDDRR